MAHEAIAFNPSSHITGISYDEETGDLIVSFPRGRYLYHDVSPADANGFRNAASAGQHLEAVVKSQYKFTKLG